MKGIKLTIVFIFIWSNAFSQIVREIDSLSKVLNEYKYQESVGKKNSDSMYVGLLNMISFKYYLRSNNDSAYFFANEAEVRSISNNYQKGLGISMIRKGYIIEESGDFPKAFDLYNGALTIFIAIKDKQEEASTLGTLASIYVELGNYEKAYELYQQSIVIFELINDEKGLSNSYINIGLTYASQKKYDLAIEYSLKAIPYKEKLGDKRGLSVLYGNLGAFFANQKNLEEGIIYMEKSLIEKEKIGDQVSIAASCSGIGNINFNLEKFDKALEYFIRGYGIAKKSKFDQMAETD